MKPKNVALPLFAVLAFLVALLAISCAAPEPAREPEVTEEATTEEIVGLELPQPTLLGAGYAPDASGRVELTYQEEIDDGCAEEHAGSACVLTDPANGQIWKDNPNNSGKPKKVRWWIPKAQKGVYYFEIVHKGDPAENWLNTVNPIDCNSNHTTSIKPNATTLPPGELEWPYRVTVYRCTEAGEKGDCLCKTDPRIEIHP